MSDTVTAAATGVLMLIALAIGAACAQPAGAPQVTLADVGPRGPVGADVPVEAAETEGLPTRVTVEGPTPEALRAACSRAVADKTPVVFLPAGEYVFDSTVKVPAGLTILGAGAATVVRCAGKNTRLFEIAGDGVRITRLRLQGFDPTPSTGNDSYGISAYGVQNLRVDHCEFSGFSYANSFGSEASVQVDHCLIHDNLRDGLGYGVAVYSGAYVLMCDNDFSQCRHAVATNGNLDWSSPARLGKYVHRPGRLTHWELIHNRLGSNDRSRNELAMVDTHPGMDGSFVVEGNLFEDLRLGIHFRDGSGLIRNNLFRNLRTYTNFRPCMEITLGAGPHNNIPVEGCMPHDIWVTGNLTFSAKDGTWQPSRYSIGKAENVTVDGTLVPQTRVDREPNRTLLRLESMGPAGVLRWLEATVEGK